MKPIRLFLLVILCLFTSVMAQTDSLLTSSMTQAFEESHLPGLSVAMVTKDSILYQHSFGFADIATSKEYDIHSIQNIGSISKTLIGVSLMKLVDQGKLSLDDPVNQYLPFKVIHPTFPSTLITIRHLATHTSGIRDRPANYEFISYYLDSSYQQTSIDKRGFSVTEKIFLNRIRNNRRIPISQLLQDILSSEGALYADKNFYDFKPGTQYEYSNLGATLAAHIVELISGLSYEAFTESAILEPLNMTSTGWYYEDVEMDKFVTRYLGKKLAVIPYYEISTYPDGGLKTNVVDMSKFLMEMMKGYEGEGSLLTDTSYQILFQNQLSVPDGERNGIFWDIFGETGMGDIGHSGIDPGVYCFMYFSPDTGIGKLLLTNANGKTYQEQTIKAWETFIRMETLFLTNDR